MPSTSKGLPYQSTSDVTTPITSSNNEESSQASIPTDEYSDNFLNMEANVINFLVNQLIKQKESQSVAEDTSTSDEEIARIIEMNLTKSALEEDESSSVSSNSDGYEAGYDSSEEEHSFRHVLPLPKNRERNLIKNRILKKIFSFKK